VNAVAMRQNTERDMTDFCLICETEPISRGGWIYDQETTEAVCPWCVNDFRKIRDLVKTHDGSNFHAVEIFGQIEDILYEKTTHGERHEE